MIYEVCFDMIDSPSLYAVSSGVYVFSANDQHIAYLAEKTLSFI